MTKEILFAEQTREKLLSGVKKISAAVKITMGASGKCTLIGNAIYGNDGLYSLPTIVTKDGYTVTKHFELADKLENRGAMIIKEAAAKTVEMAGDATTCTCVLAEDIITEGMRLIAAGANSQQLKRGIDYGLKIVIEELQGMSIPVKGDAEKIKHIATVSANNDNSIGELISEAYKKIGDEGVIDIEAGSGIQTEIKLAEGLKFEKGWVSQFLINNVAKQSCELVEPVVLLYDRRITHHTQIQEAVKSSLKLGKPILVICEDCEEEGLAFFVINKQQKDLKCCIVKSPGFGDFRHEQMEDIALLTGGTYISDRKGIDIKKSFNPIYFGKCKKAIITKDETILIGGEGDKGGIENLLNDLRMNLTQAKTEEEKIPIEKRIARLTGGIAVIHVGAATETEMKEKLDRFDDAVRSVKAAISEGFVAGGGTAFVRIWQKLFINDNDLNAYDSGKKIVLSSLTRPLFQMAENNAIDGKEVLNKVIEKTGSFGYNTLTGDIEDMIKSGIIDSTKALRCAITNAVSVAGYALTTECLIETVS